jgi:hypothetical protein
MASLRPIRPRLLSLLTLLIVFAQLRAAGAQTTTFTYQGRLYDVAGPATGSYDLELRLFDSEAVGTGTQQGATLNVPAVQVVGGLFTVPLDFGLAGFPGADRFLEIAVRRVGDPSFTTLSPRQALTSTPYSIRSLAATEVTGPVAGSQIDGSIPVASMPAGSASYIQNGTSPQAPADFNISGNGSAAILSASTQFNLGSNRILGQPGTNNLVAGLNAGVSNTTGTANAFFGQNAGQSNTSGSSNEFFGYNAGNHTTTGFNNSFFGDAAGFDNITGANNSFFGFLAGFHSTASFNSYFGNSAGANSGNGQFNSMFGTAAGVNTTGSHNSFFGRQTGQSNTVGSSNTLLGAGANVAVNNLDHATAIGADAFVSTSNTLVLGRNVDTTLVAGTLNVAGSLISFAGSRILSNAGFGNLFAGVGAGAVNTGSTNAFFGVNAGLGNTAGGSNAFFGSSAGRNNTTAFSNAFFGTNAGFNNTTGASNSFFGDGAGFNNTVGGLNSFFGASAGNGSTGDQNAFFGQGTGVIASGSFNTFIGQAAGNNNGSGSQNVFVGWFAGSAYGSAGFNTFVGSRAGFTVPVPPDPTGSNNTALGVAANVTAGLFNATAMGANAQVTQSNSLVLGGSGVRIGIGNTAPQAKLHITDGSTNMFFGSAGCATPGYSGIGFSSPLSCTNYSLLGGDNDTYVNRPAGGAIHFREGNFEQVTINSGGIVTIQQLGAGGTATLCRNPSNQISFCSSSLRYKTELAPFRGGMDVVSRLRPIAFTWKDGGAQDLGLGAEEVAQVEPLLVTRNDKGEIEGVKYDHLSVVFINALMELQAQIRAQQLELRRQEREIEGLRRLLAQPGSAGSGNESTSTGPSGRTPDVQ